MPLSAQQLRALEATIRSEAEQTLRDKGWEGTAVLVQSPYADELALRIEARARVNVQHTISAASYVENPYIVTRALQESLAQVPALLQ